MSVWMRKKRVYALLLLAVLLLLFFDRSLLGKLMYPIRYEETITEYAETYEVDPYLVASIIRVESNFHPDKLSPKGAIGLMQLMPPTAEWIVKQEGASLSDLDRLDEAAINIRYGTWYIRSLKQQFAKMDTPKEDEIARIAAAYNAGPGNVDRWLTEGRWSGMLASASTEIPFGETRHYVNRVHYYYQKYARTYPELGSRALSE
ncbi:lytic transglycosylase domain-containing protein [Paenibacillus sp. TRM 82003]|nr:lytic transglycosylase domain-containing protein [Paenibacillus sp. TRM 82003]